MKERCSVHPSVSLKIDGEYVSCSSCDFDTPAFYDLCEMVDAFIMEEMRRDSLGIALDMFNYFNSPVKPLSPREFLHFWVHLTDDDKLDYISATTKPLSAATGIRGLLLPGEIVTITEGKQT